MVGVGRRGETSIYTSVNLYIIASAGTVDYTGGEEVRANLLKGRSSAKPEAHESLAHG